MSIPPVPNNGYIHDLKGVNGKAWWQNTGVKISEGDSSTPDTTPLKKYMVIISGQSNAQGSSLEAQLASEKVSNPKIKQYSRGVNKTFSGQSIWYDPKTKGDIIPALDPLQHHGIADVNSIGFARTFCEDFLKDNPNSEITIMPCALGGTSFVGMNINGYTISWDNTMNTSKNLYKEMVDDCNTVLNDTPDMEVLAILWLQGESDVGNGQYPMKLQKLVRDTRTDIKINEKVPFVVGTMLKEWRMKNSLTEYIHNSHKWIKWAPNMGNTDCADFDHISGATPDGMGVHYTANGLRQMGHDFYLKFKEMSTVKPKENTRSIDIFDVGGEKPTWETVCEQLSYNECHVKEN